MKTTTLFVAVASAFSLSAYAGSYGSSRSASDSSWGQATQRVESMNGQRDQSQSSDLVKQAQEKLSALGKDVGTADGEMNPKTEQALTEYQQEKGLTPSGELDQQTIASLDLGQSGSAASGSSRPSDSD